MKSVRFCKHFVEKVGGKTKIYIKVYNELVTGQMAFRQCLFKACTCSSLLHWDRKWDRKWGLWAFACARSCTAACNLL